MAKCFECGAKKATGTPPLCGACYSDSLRENAESRGLLDTLLGHPAVRQIFDSASSKVSQAVDSSAQKLANKLDQYVQLGMMAAQAKMAAKPAKPTGPDPRVIMGFGPDEVLSKDKIKGRKRELSRIYHSDKGGHDEAMKRLNWASQELLKSLNDIT